ncbi:uncharacterized protein LOC126356297 isoform X2 [Schistocerca gregaria]|uniref:uncharacterized protein LOC126356297 isoform X2 n=1 Tax=Schistocerca gregaria TaxID=7010 RepID=UPI00211EEF34|nr:uncharacterized protein LOC126356297 isoform X2 [Schistocerca gregaria]XP_049863190.1 uncharacterized protein LOC126356297 isoform X2 [Schistocerca gregaria]
MANSDGIANLWAEDQNKYWLHRRKSTEEFCSSVVDILGTLYSRILRTAQPQQPPEGVIITQHDDPMEVEPSPPLPPLILAMELDPSSYRWS